MELKDRLNSVARKVETLRQRYLSLLGRASRVGDREAGEGSEPAED